MKASTDLPLDGVFDTPEHVFAGFTEDAAAAGGEYVPPPEDAGCLGRTMFDSSTSADGTVTVLLPAENIDRLPTQSLVRIESGGTTYLGTVVAGPFAEPDGLRADAVALVVTTVRGGVLMPRHHGRCQVEILGQRLPDENGSGTLVPARRRPKPNSPVFPLDDADAAAVLKLAGDLRLGLADGFDDLPVCVPGKAKGVFPRHVGILGTTGGGKSTTVAGLVAQAQKLGMAVVLIDTEGEYAAIHEPTPDPVMLAELARRHLQPAGVPNVTLFHPVGREMANPDHPALCPFSLRFSALSPYAVAEILDLNDAQQERFFKAYDVTKRAMETFGMFPRKANARWRDKDRTRVLTLDEQETGYPLMTLAHLYDVIREIECVVDKRDEEPELDTAPFSAGRKQLRQFLNADGFPKNVASWRAVLGKVGRLKRLKIFDSRQAKPLPFDAMLRPGELNVVDLSDADSPAVRNLVIAELLRGVQQQQEREYKRAVAENRNPTPVLVVIEEAHEFLSAERIRQMPTLFGQVARIARRGRKRYLGLCFVTQLPGHLPNEVLGLINNWILHKIADAGVIAGLKKNIGGVPDPLWRTLPNLPPGGAIASFTTMARPLQTSIDPAACRVLMTE